MEADLQAFGIQQAREQLRTIIDNTLEHHNHTVITRSGRPVAVVVPYAWYLRIKEQPTTGDDPNA